MTNFEVTLFGMSGFYVLTETVFQGVSIIATFFWTFPGFVCFMFVLDVLLQYFEILQKKYINILETKQ
jgi:hypothetical protein